MYYLLELSLEVRPEQQFYMILHAQLEARHGVQPSSLVITEVCQDCIY